MNNPIFLTIAALIEQRISGISQADGFAHDLGQSVYVNGMVPVPLDDDGTPHPGTVLVEPGESTSTVDGGDVRMSTAPMEARFERTVEVLVVWPIEDKSQWLMLSEQIALDLRTALYADQSELQNASIVSIRQVSQESSFPQTGANSLIVKLDFLIRYVGN